MRPTPACAALTAAAGRARPRRLRGGGADKAGGEQKLEADRADARQRQRRLGRARAVRRRGASSAVGGTLRIEFKNAWRRGHGRLRGRRDPRREGRQGRSRVGGHARLRRRRRAGVRRAPRAAADRQPCRSSARCSRARSCREMLDGLEPLGVVGVGILPGPAAQAARRLARSCAPRTTPARRSRSSARRSPSRRCARSARAARRSPAAGAIEGYDGVEQQLRRSPATTTTRVASHLTANVNLWPRPLVLFINPKAFERAQRPPAGRAARRRRGVRDVPQQAADGRDVSRRGEPRRRQGRPVRRARRCSSSRRPTRRVKARSQIRRCGPRGLQPVVRTGSSTRAQPRIGDRHDPRTARPATRQRTPATAPGPAQAGSRRPAPVAVRAGSRRAARAPRSTACG